MTRGSTFNGTNEEFARATMDSSNTSNSESDTCEPRDSYNNKIE